MLTKKYFVYLISNWNNKVYYIGVTNNLNRRINEHKQGVADSFSKKYNINKLLYYEEFNDIREAIKREKCLKGKKRNFKEELIKKLNPELKDLSIHL